jgi:hypothetical protein
MWSRILKLLMDYEPLLILELHLSWILGLASDIPENDSESMKLDIMISIG